MPWLAVASWLCQLDWVLLGHLRFVLGQLQQTLFFASAVVHSELVAAAAVVVVVVVEAVVVEVVAEVVVEVVVVEVVAEVVAVASVVEGAETSVEFKRETQPCCEKHTLTKRNETPKLFFSYFFALLPFSFLLSLPLHHFLHQGGQWAGRLPSPSALVHYLVESANQKKTNTETETETETDADTQTDTDTDKASNSKHWGQFQIQSTKQSCGSQAAQTHIHLAVRDDGRGKWDFLFWEVKDGFNCRSAIMARNCHLEHCVTAPQIILFSLPAARALLTLRLCLLPLQPCHPLAILLLVSAYVCEFVCVCV